MSVYLIEWIEFPVVQIPFVDVRSYHDGVHPECPHASLHFFRGHLGVLERDRRGPHEPARVALDHGGEVIVQVAAEVQGVLGLGLKVRNSENIYLAGLLFF